MKQHTFRIAAALCALTASGAAMAENYVAKIYSVPPGTIFFSVLGAGNGGMMSGNISDQTTTRAVYRTNSGLKYMDPPNWYWSIITDSWGSTYHVGYGYETSISSPRRAFFWVGGGPPIPLHPSDGATQSVALGGGGQQQVGFVNDPNYCPECDVNGGQHAVMWSRTASSKKRLHAKYHAGVSASGTDGLTQVGYGRKLADNQVLALLWGGPETFATPLHPTGYTESRAVSVSGNQQGGFVIGPQTGGNAHAAIWSGTAGSMVDLNPPAFVSTKINSVKNGLQVGTGNPVTTPSRNRALAWHGKAATWINLHMRLPYPFYYQWESFASDIDDQGNITGYIENISTGYQRPVVWMRTP